MGKIIGVGFTIKLSTTGSTTFGVTLGQVRSVSGPGVSADVIDTSCMDITNNYRTKGVGLLDGGDITVNVAYDPAADSHITARSLMSNRTATGVQVIYPTTTVSWEAQGYISGITNEIPLADLVTADFTLSVSGKPTFDEST